MRPFPIEALHALLVRLFWLVDAYCFGEWVCFLVHWLTSHHEQERVHFSLTDELAQWFFNTLDKFYTPLPREVRSKRKDVVQ
jgi:hypothetical protein